MTNKEINEYLAENMFGLVRQKDFGEWKEHDWQKDDDGSIDNWAFSLGYCNGPMCQRCHHFFCEHCSKDYEKELHAGPCVIEAPDYIKNYELVIAKCKGLAIKKCNTQWIVVYNNHRGISKDLGKAICAAAITYLQRSKKNG